MADEKLQKVLARSGVGSRREMERWIEAGRVQVNDTLATLGDRVTNQDKIKVDGREIKTMSVRATGRRVVLYNKPLGEICTRNDPEGRPTVFRHLPPLKGGRWIAIGRLDINTSGLLLFTNDGEFANALMHPSANIDREYAVRVLGEVKEENLKAMREGVLLEDGLAKFSDVQFFNGEGANSWYHSVLMSGKNREVRRLWESQNLQVSRLKRVRYGPVFLSSDVRAGTWRELESKEVKDLSSILDVPRRSNKVLSTAEKEKLERRYKHQRTRRSVDKK